MSADADRLAAFYVEALGFVVEARLTFEQGTVLRLRNGAARLKVFQPAGGASGAGRPDPWHAETGFRYAALQVSDADAVFERAVAGGGTPMVEPTAHRPGARYALLADPEGNVWELLEESG